MHASRDLPKQSSARATGGPSLKDVDIHNAALQVAQYLREQREHFFPGSKRLGKEYRRVMASFFSEQLLSSVAFVEWAGPRLKNPPFHDEARARGFSSLPELRHMASVTFLDVVVIREEPTERIVFHGLVHAVQCQMLGLQRYAELFVRGLAQVHSHYLVPLEAQAFSLDARFAVNPEKAFSVEEEVRRWIKKDRYLIS